MDANGTSKSFEIRKRLNHPILDSDGHWLEFEPVVLDYLKDVAGAEMVAEYRSWQRNRSIGVWYRLTPEERRDMRALRPIWWGVATKNTLDRATATLPKLLNERLDETGIDFSVIYPSLGLFAPRIDDSEHNSEEKCGNLSCPSPSVRRSCSPPIRSRSGSANSGRSSR